MVGVLIISTRKYKQFVQKLIDQIDEFFIPAQEKMVFLFTDEFIPVKSNLLVQQLFIPAYSFPYATLYRYKTFMTYKSHLKDCSHLFYIDADMAVVDKVGEDLLTTGLVVVRHPGFYVNDGWGDSSNPRESSSYLPVEERTHYYAGGFQGGESSTFLKMSEILAAAIDTDDKKGIIAEHNDETHFNTFISKFKPYNLLELTPEYCMVEQPHLREAWGIANLSPKIIALNKNHNEIRS